MGPFREKRRKLFINPHFQIMFIGYIVAATLVGILALYGANILFFSKLETEAISLGITSGHPYFKMLQSQKESLHLMFLLISAHVLLLLTLTGLYISHKVAGPLEKMRRHIERFQQGEKTGPLSFRRGDFFQEWPPLINGLLSSSKAEKERASS